jgi:hypothetical protein
MYTYLLYSQRYAYCKETVYIFLNNISDNKTRQATHWWSSIFKRNVSPKHKIIINPLKTKRICFI